MTASRKRKGGEFAEIRRLARRIDDLFDRVLSEWAGCPGDPFIPDEAATYLSDNVHTTCTAIRWLCGGGFNAQHLGKLSERLEERHAREIATMRGFEIDYNVGRRRPLMMEKEWSSDVEYMERPPGTRKLARELGVGPTRRKNAR